MPVPGCQAMSPVVPTNLKCWWSKLRQVYQSLKRAGRYGNMIESQIGSCRGECTMKCPYCQEEMQRGYIPNGGQPVQWIPNGERPSVLSFSIAEQGVPLINQFKPLKANGYKAEAHYCSNCKVIIAPTKNWLQSVNFQFDELITSRIALSRTLRGRVYFSLCPR